MQIRYGKHSVDFIGEIATPVAWACFLTGKDVTKLGYNLRSAIEKKVTESYNPLLRPLYKLRTKLIKRKKLGLRDIAIKLGLFKRRPYRLPKHLHEQTFIEVLKREGYRVAAIEVPTYSSEVNEELTPEVLKLLSSGIKEKNRFLRDVVMKECSKRIERARKLVDEYYDLVFVYLPMPDLAHHLLYRTKLELILLRKYYDDLAELVKHLIDNAASRGYTVLIVSDHGFDLERRDHSNYGFWSLNRDIDIGFTKITDFYSYIISEVKAEKKERLM